MSAREPDPPWSDLPAAIHASGRRLMLAVVGGGSGAISRLLETPGASRSILGAVVPYAQSAMAHFLGGPPDQACSSETARAMAMAAFRLARSFANDIDPHTLVGVGCTASLASDRPKRGARRIHVAVQRADRTEVQSLALVEPDGDRARDEMVATALLLTVIASACGVDASDLRDWLPAGRHGEALTIDSELATPARTELLVGQRSCAIVKPHSAVEHFAPGEQPPLPVVFPGAFNPPHAGHLQMAALAERRLGQPLAWELSIANVDKPLLDFIAIRTRIEALRLDDQARPIALTRAPTFREKGALFPGATFVVGADTIIRIADPRYYGGDASQRDGAVAAIAAQGCRFLVFGRQLVDGFQTLSGLELPPTLAALCDEVPADHFREDISSSEIRAASEPPAS
jgi:nicotinamide mononucleotide (NMN) deamidase PncC